MFYHREPSNLKKLRAHYFISENYCKSQYFHFTKPLQIGLFPPSDPNGIVRPNSLWTAGCCVVGAKGVGSIAVWGNNDKIDAETEPMPLTDLEKLLVASTSPPADLFPAFPGCKANPYLSLEALKSVIQ